MSATLTSLSVAAALAVALLATATGPARAGEPATYDAAPALAAPVLQPVAAGDVAGLLRNCAAEHAACALRVEALEADQIGVPYLVWAYMALWAILFTFLIIARSGQRKLKGELEELRERLAVLQERQP
jgi:hypothetical protein